MSFFKSFYTLACTWHWLYLSLNWILYWDLFALPLFIFLMRKGLHIGLITNAFRYLPFGKALNLVSLEGCFSVLDLGDLLLYLQYSKAQERTFPLQPKTGKIQNMIRNKCPSPVGRASKPLSFKKKQRFCLLWDQIINAVSNPILAPAVSPWLIPRFWFCLIW